MIKNSDSDYKAEDEGSATDSKRHKMHVKKNGVPNYKLLNKKDLLELSFKNFIPQGVTLTKSQEITQQNYDKLVGLQDAPEFSLNYKKFLAKVCKVVDGDTIKVLLLLNNNFTRFTLRLNGIDTPETRKGDVKDFGKLVKEITIEMLSGKVVKVEAGEFDKYGRVLARVYAYDQQDRKEFCFNDFLIKFDLAKVYSGKGKTEFSREDFQLFKDKHGNKKWPNVINFPLKQFG